MEMTSLSQTSPSSSTVPNFYFPFCVYTISFFPSLFETLPLIYRDLLVVPLQIRIVNNVSMLRSNLPPSPHGDFLVALILI
ncbi:hypothetical protein BDV36DRAFT_252159 [Aspergillus pseudocaelatus]|uniref:Uncharacterized protein n=1 Tax=Aspergillus pseudocaelatus TaxID=1825620 RepID=A0ABQ6WQ36_9EURO|nr:hypothetical protein BDV36DRAFT_252159 [Aspergillus pseudocaelatus]